MSALPKTVKRVAVLDRTKEPGANGEPLYLDVKDVFYGKADAPLIVGGRYGLASKDTTPTQILSVYENLSLPEPKNHFTIGIVDDVTFTSLPPKEELALGGEYGHSLGRTLRGRRELHVMGDSLFSRMLAYTSAACDARMAGAMVPVMSNSGSGNQGLTVSLPVIEYAQQLGADQETLYRALLISNLLSIHIKRHIGVLSAFCGAVSAAAGAGAAITFLYSGTYDQICTYREPPIHFSIAAPWQSSSEHRIDSWICSILPDTR